MHYEANQENIDYVYHLLGWLPPFDFKVAQIKRNAQLIELGHMRPEEILRCTGRSTLMTTKAYCLYHEGFDVQVICHSKNSKALIMKKFNAIYDKVEGVPYVSINIPSRPRRNQVLFNTSRMAVRGFSGAVFYDNALIDFRNREPIRVM